MKRILFPSALLALPALLPMASAQLILTEIQSNQSASNSGDYWELTNAGSSAINIGGYRWTDYTGGNTFETAIAIPEGTSIGAGESIIFTHASEANFRTWWGSSLAAGTRIFPTPVGDPGLGSADGITLYNSAGTAVIQFSYAAGGFTRLDGSASIGGHAGPSARPAGATAINHSALVWVSSTGTASPRYTAADGTTQGTFTAATGADLGSPGYSGAGGGGPTFSLSVSVTPSAFSESAANPAASGTVTRTGDLTSALVVTLASSDT
ncbi:MAG TPA: lamin tail domain-containing protein, partial [Luteolibacter sp.]|nr:lamin tail domain-containing protein [Luteolibacter sp.]